MRSEVLDSLLRLSSRHREEACDIGGVDEVPRAHAGEHDGLVNKCRGKSGYLELDRSSLEPNADRFRRQLEREGSAVGPEEDLLADLRRLTPTSTGRHEKIHEHAVIPAQPEGFFVGAEARFREPPRHE